MKIKKIGDILSFTCPGCNEIHQVSSSWTWNGSLDLPTLSPSILVTSGCYCPGFKPGENCWCTYKQEYPDKEVSFNCGRCHSFVVEGQIQFLADCTHSLAGKTVSLPDWE